MHTLIWWTLCHLHRVLGGRKQFLCPPQRAWMWPTYSFLHGWLVSAARLTVALSLLRSCGQHWRDLWARSFTALLHTIPRLTECANVFINPLRQGCGLRSWTANGWMTGLGRCLGCLQILRRMWTLCLLSWKKVLSTPEKRVEEECCSLVSSFSADQSTPVHHCPLPSFMPTGLATARLVSLRQDAHRSAFNINHINDINHQFSS